MRGRGEGERWVVGLRGGLSARLCPHRVQLGEVLFVFRRRQGCPSCGKVLEISLGWGGLEDSGGFGIGLEVSPLPTPGNSLMFDARFVFGMVTGRGGDGVGLGLRLRAARPTACSVLAQH